MRLAATSTVGGTGVWLLLGICVLAPSARRGDAQPGPAPLPTVMMLRRVAEAVDGHRTRDGRPVYVVASPVDSIGVVGVFESRDSAVAVASAAAPQRQLGVSGPYATPVDVAGRGPMLLGGCVHAHSTIWAPRPLYCPEPRPGPRPGPGPGPQPGEWGPDPVPFEDVTGIEVTVRLRNGTARTMTLPPSIDAVFFDLDAIDKFVLPYYVRIVGVDQAAAMRRGILSGIR